MDMCGDNRFEIIARAKKDILDATNIDTSPKEMEVLDEILFRCWQMGWLDRYDTADTPQTETQMKTQNSNLTFEKADEPQTERRCTDCRFLTHKFGKVWCDIKCDNPHDVVCERWEARQTDCQWR